MSELFDTIANSIENNKCVLVLGPDLFLKESEGKIIERKQYFSEIEKQIPSCIYFPQEDVFDFNPNDRRAIKKSVFDFYSNEGDIKLYELIASIRFPLILNASPDAALKDFCDSNGITMQFESFHGFNDENSSISFNSDNALLYNLFGNSKDLQELIIDHKQLFKHIQKILPENSFPLSIKTFLSNANCFIFLGFKFNSWIFQLLSYKILNHKNDSISEDDRLRLSHIGIDREKIREIEIEKSKHTIKSTTINNENIINIVMASSVGMEFTDITPAQLIFEIVSSLKSIEKKNMGKKFTRDVKNQEKYSSYLSYAHFDKPNSEIEVKMGELTDLFIRNFRSATQDDTHLKFIVDTDALHYGQSIDSFMTRIGKGKTVILIISDKYLKSKYCMTEMLRIFKYNNNDKRAFAVMVKDNIDTPESYEKFWKDKAIEFVTENKSNIKDINSALEFSNEFKNLFNKLNDIKYLEIELSYFDSRDNNKFHLTTYRQEALDEFTKDIIFKLKE